jgi:hypothetical protein
MNGATVVGPVREKRQRRRTKAQADSEASDDEILNVHDSILAGRIQTPALVFLGNGQRARKRAQRKTPAAMRKTIEEESFQPRDDSTSAKWNHSSIEPTFVSGNIATNKEPPSSQGHKKRQQLFDENNESLLGYIDAYAEYVNYGTITSETCQRCGAASKFVIPI